MATGLAAALWHMASSSTFVAYFTLLLLVLAVPALRPKDRAVAD